MTGTVITKFSNSLPASLATYWYDDIPLAAALARQSVIETAKIELAHGVCRQVSLRRVRRRGTPGRPESSSPKGLRAAGSPRTPSPESLHPAVGLAATLSS